MEECDKINIEEEDSNVLKLTEEEIKAVNNLVSLSCKKPFPMIPTVEFIRDFMNCEKCKFQCRALRIQTLIYCCFTGDFSFIEGCFLYDKEFNALRKRPFEATVLEDKDDNALGVNNDSIKSIINGSTKPFNNDVIKTGIKDSTYKIKLPIQKEDPKLGDHALKNGDTSKSKIAPLVCHKCHNVFTTKNGMKYHLKYVHTKENENVIKPYKCPFTDICKRRYKNKNGLYYHLHHHHKNESLDSVYGNSLKSKNILATKEIEK